MRRLVFVMLALWMVMPVLAQEAETPEVKPAALLTDPFLQLPTADGVHVVWFTEFVGTGHTVSYGAALDQTAEATTIKLSRMYEDSGSRVGEQTENGQVYQQITARDIWRHEALVSGISERVPYYVTSIADDGTAVRSEEFTLAPLPQPGQNLTILLTSDHQLMPMTPANMQKVEETIGRVDAVFFAGDMQNIPDRASEWFDDNRGRAFFPGLQGNANLLLTRTPEDHGAREASETLYTGGEIIQHAPMFTAVGNHEVMGRYDFALNLNQQYNNPQPRTVAEQRYELYKDLVNPANDPEVRERWITDNSFNSTTYEEIVTVPDEGPEGERYYAIQFGDVYLISLYATRIAHERDKMYTEIPANLNNPNNWNYGQMLFNTIEAGNPQYNWLQDQLSSEAFQSAKYKIIMMHEPIHGLGGRLIPAFTHPVQMLEYDENNNLVAVRYEYPKADNHLVRDLEPMLEGAGANFVLNGHMHIWNRMVSESGIHFMETSNVGNTYRANWQGESNRRLPFDDRWNMADYDALGDPYGLEPVFPTIMSPQTDEEGNPVPYVASNEITVFSIFTTEDGMIRSYYFDTREPESEVVLFDEFSILGS